MPGEAQFVQYNQCIPISVGPGKIILLFSYKSTENPFNFVIIITKKGVKSTVVIEDGTLEALKKKLFDIIKDIIEIDNMMIDPPDTIELHQCVENIIFYLLQ